MLLWPNSFNIFMRTKILWRKKISEWKTRCKNEKLKRLRSEFMCMECIHNAAVVWSIIIIKSLLYDNAQIVPKECMHKMNFKYWIIRRVYTSRVVVVSLFVFYFSVAVVIALILFFWCGMLFTWEMRTCT